MPIYEYSCRPCANTFEELILRRSDESEVACPKCKGKAVSRIMSRTAATHVRGDGGSSSAPSCGPIG